MTEQITLEEALKLVSFYDTGAREWVVLSVNGDVNGFVKGYINGDVNGDINGDVNGNIRGDVVGTVYGDVNGDVLDNVVGTVRGKINGREWKSVETPKDKLQRLITESGNQKLIDTFNQLEDN